MDIATVIPAPSTFKNCSSASHTYTSNEGSICLSGAFFDSQFANRLWLCLIINISNSNNNNSPFLDYHFPALLSVASYVWICFDTVSALKHFKQVSFSVQLRWYEMCVVNIGFVWCASGYIFQSKEWQTFWT